LAAPAAAKPVVLELFTSQGCSSCPPADKVLEDISTTPGVVAISRPITYWDRLGWKDTLARPANTERQRAYRGLSGRLGVYTPQIVIDGDWEGNGSARAQVAAEVRRTLREPTLAEVKFTRAPNGQFAVEVGGVKSDAAEVRLIALESAPTVDIERGENRGRKITYTNVVTSEHVLGSWDGGRKRWTIADDDLAALDGDRLAVVVQRKGLGTVLGAAIMERPVAPQPAAPNTETASLGDERF
ncbi:MAG: DUF1223 domain-containing protein, partial [Pseudomonadota bacterium]